MFQEIMQDILALAGLLGLLYAGAWVVEYARFRFRRKMHVCDNCFEIVKKIKDL